MANSPHQPESLAQEITRLKADLLREENLLAQIQTIGQSNAGGGMSTTYQDPVKLQAHIDHLRAIIKAKVDQLNGTTDYGQPGVNELRYVGGYNDCP